MIRKRKVLLKRARGFSSDYTKEEVQESKDLLMRSPLFIPTNPHQAGSATGTSYNCNNNGKHHYRRLSSDYEVRAEGKTKGVLKSKKRKARNPEVISPTARKASVELLLSPEVSTTKIPANRILSRNSSDMDDFCDMRLPAEYPPPADYARRRSSAHRVSYKKAIQKAGYNMNELGASTLNQSPSIQHNRAAHCLTETDWSESAVPDHHIWSPSNASGDLCYVGEQFCLKSGPRKKCNACHIVVHDACYSQFVKIDFPCKVTFRESLSRNARENLVVHHHWVHRRKLEGKCRQCGKAFEKRFGFREPTKIIAISCSWCKEAFHNKVSCFQMHKINEPCSLGCFTKSIIPPTWIIKQSHQKQKSLRGRSKKKKSSSGGWRRRSTKDSQKPKTFIVRPLSQQAAFVTPTLIFINPKSGGKQGAKLMQQFQWFMNPRQICDLSKGGPKEALELYRKVPNLRLLACGGDGTVGWILSVLDKLSLPTAPPVGILPLGTGNDLSRTLNFGPGYSESDSIVKIIQGIEEARVVKLDRWKLTLKKNMDAVRSIGDDEISNDSQSHHGVGVDELPLDIVNNYFSIGFDAKVALNFHNSREARPDKFTSRIGNKMYYAKASVLEYMTSEAKDLYRHTSLFCDGMDYTSKIRELKPVCILFLNIPRYSSGSIPWGNPTGSEFKVQCHDDKLIEVLAFGVHQLGMVLVGGHGERICQCRSAHVKTNKPFPVQIDGEPCLLNPSTVKIEFFNQVNMLYKSKRRGSVLSDHHPTHEQIKIRVNLVHAQLFDDFNGKKDPICHSSTPLLVTVVMHQSTLDTVRSCLVLIMNEMDRPPDSVSEKWIFLDSSSPDKFYKIDKLRENLLAISDVINDDREVYILDIPDPKAHPGNFRMFPRSQLVDRQTVLRNRVKSDSGLLSRSSDSFSSLTRSEQIDDESNIDTFDEEDQDLPDPTSSLLDVVFEQPEVAELEHDGAATSSHVNGDVNHGLHLTESQTKPISSSIPALQNESRYESDCSSYSTSSNEYLLSDEQRSSPSQHKKTPLKPSLSSPLEPAERSLPAEFASHLNLESPRIRKHKKKVHRRSNTDTDPKKTAGFSSSRSQLLGLVSSNKNHSNNASGKHGERALKKPCSHDSSLSSGTYDIMADKNGQLPREADGGSLANKENSFSACVSEDPKDSLISQQHEKNLFESWDKIFLDASKRGDVAKMTLSVKQGIDLCLRDDEGCSALHHAVRFSNMGVIDFLLQQGESKIVDLTCRHRKQTALHKAAWYGRREICEKLLNAGASLDIRDYKDMTAIDRAKQAEDPELVRFLADFQTKKYDDKQFFETDL